MRRRTFEINGLHRPVKRQASLRWPVMVGVLLWGMLFCREFLLPESQRVWKNPVEKVTLTEGLDYFYQYDKTSDLTMIQLLIRGGKLAVPVEKRGIATVTTRLTVELPSADQLRQLMLLGSSMSSQIMGDYAAITIKSLSPKLDDTLKLVAHSIVSPLLSRLRIDNYKEHMAHRMKSSEDIPEILMEQTFLQAISGNGTHGYGGSIYGTDESRKKIKRKDVLSFYKEFFNKSNIVLSASSNLKKEELTDILNRHFGSMADGKRQVLPPFTGTVAKEKTIFLEKDNQQVLLSVGVLLPPIDEANYTALYMLENLLGKGIGSKLWSLRSTDELAYNLNSRFIQHHAGGVLIIYLKTDEGKVDDARKALKKLLKDVYVTGITEEELEVTKVRSSADFLRSNETKEQRVRQMAYFEAMGLGAGFLETFFQKVQGMELKTINSYLKQILAPQEWVEVIIGPSSAKPKELD